MPIYEYVCDKCLKTHEKLAKVDEPAPAVCPHCGAPGPRKALGAPGFVLKGGGYYATDFKTQTCAAQKDGTCPCKGS